MSTPFFLRVYDNDNRVLLNLYCKWDGYIETVGRFLAHRLQTMEVVDGISNDLLNRMYCGDEIVPLRYYANGMGCLAGQLVADMKHGLGGIYIEHLDFNLDNDVCYIYEVRPSDVRGTCGTLPHITCRSAGTIFGGILYSGRPDRYFDFITSGEHLM